MIKKSAAAPSQRPAGLEPESVVDETRYNLTLEALVALPTLFLSGSQACFAPKQPRNLHAGAINALINPLQPILSLFTLQTVVCVRAPEFNVSLTASRRLNPHVASWKRVPCEQQLNLSVFERDQRDVTDEMRTPWKLPVDVASKNCVWLTRALKFL